MPKQITRMVLGSRKGAFAALSLLFFSLSSQAAAQNLIVVYGSGSEPTNIPFHTAAPAFIQSNAESAQEALKTTAIGAAQGKVISAVAMKSVPMLGPVVGALPVEGMLKIFGHRRQSVKGFYITSIPGLSANTSVPATDFSLLLPKQSRQVLGQPDSTAALLRLRPSAKDGARIVRSLHVATTLSGGKATEQILGTEQDIVACDTQERSAGDVVLAPKSPLAAGEYAVVLFSSQQSASSGFVLWDFRIQ